MHSFLVTYKVFNFTRFAYFGYNFGIIWFPIVEITSRFQFSAILRKYNYFFFKQN